MVPTNRKPRRTWGRLAVLLAGLWAVNGCGPPGPRALLKGERLIEEGRYSEAAERLQVAVQHLPKDAVAWNCLGLAYHGSRKVNEARRAYVTALNLDHTLAAARFNLGCLLLEQDQIGPAIEQLSAFTIANPGAIEGWLRLGTARLRARHLDEAEKCFKTALEIRPQNPEALNGLGLVALERRQPLDASHQFQRALAQNPQYAPALLNLAVLSQQSLNNRLRAIQLYRQYLGLRPRPADAAAVEGIVRNLERESTPATTSPPQIVSVSPTSPPEVVSTTPAAVQPEETSPPDSAPPETTSVETNSGLLASLVPVVRTNPGIRMVPVVRPASNQVPDEPPKPAPTIVSPADATPENTAPAKLEVSQVSGDLVIRPAKDLADGSASPTTSPPPRQPGETLVTTSSLPAELRTTAERDKEKPGFFARLNPFRSRSRSSKKESPAPPVVIPGQVYLAENKAPAPAVEEPPRSIQRYSFLSPSKPAAGNRREADRFLKRGFTAHQGGRYYEAIAEYQQAVRADPSCFEAYYNIGLAALETRDYKRALPAYEYALALQPDSADARYNFALALKQADYPLDAAEQLQRLLPKTPNDVRIHLLLGNIYSQQLHQKDLARKHYERVLDLNPRHPEASRIRFWLAANP